MFLKNASSSKKTSTLLYLNTIEGPRRVVIFKGYLLYLNTIEGPRRVVIFKGYLSEV
jgi:hypothetical protein